MKHLCIKNTCTKMAVWFYLPGKEDIYYCDDCVPRGCTCRGYQEVFDEDSPDEWEEELDSEGRALPCVEYDYDENGFDE